MTRICCGLVILFGALPLLHAAPPQGSWKFTLAARQPITLLVHFSQEDGQWLGDVIDVQPRLAREPKFTHLRVAGTSLEFALNLDGTNTLSFEGQLAREGRSIKGSMSLGGDTMHLLELTASTLKSLQDPFEVAKEGLTQTEDAETAFDQARVVLRQAGAKQLPADEVRAIVDRVARLAADHGRRWERHTTLKLADLLADQKDYAEIAVAQARRAERMLNDEDPPVVRLAVLETLAAALAAAGKDEEARPVLTQWQRLEARDFAEHAAAVPAFAVEPFAGRKAPSERIVLVEFFSGTEFDPSAAVDAARDALLKAYSPQDVIVLTYHLPLQGDPNPLAVRDCLDRMQSYADFVRTGQHALVAGRKTISIKQETRLKDAAALFATLRDRIHQELEAPAAVKLSLQAAAEGDGFTAQATVSDLQQPGEKTVLRFALAADRMYYQAGNGTKYHRMVVRAMPGGTAGFPLPTAQAEHRVTIRPAEVREAIRKFLAEMAAEGEPLPRTATALKHLKLVAFVQNDATGEVLTAAMVELK